MEKQLDKRIYVYLESKLKSGQYSKISDEIEIKIYSIIRPYLDMPLEGQLKSGMKHKELTYGN
jgi:hypothetical protein